jgi:hypothetical protein
MCLIRPVGGAWLVCAAEPVGPPETLLARLRDRQAGAPVAFGIDCPIGLPRAYAAGLTGFTGFPEFLGGLEAEAGFFTVAETLQQVAPARPFYPARGQAGMRRLAHAQALGLAAAADLCRACDRATDERPAGAPLFWTLGANQSGKAAIAAWRDLLGPACRGADPPKLWPFDGEFRSLLAPGRIAIAETYPAEAQRQLGLPRIGSKRRQADRAALAPSLLQAMRRLGADPSQEAEAAIAAGFGADAAGEDRLDCLLGALCVLSVVVGERPDTAPDDPWIRNWEGWVLGQTAMPR